jgi:hypothetical protein
MRSKLPVEVHPVADLFPLMSDEEYAGLKQDIAENGLREPMTMWQSKLIDGRNRLAACLELGLDWEGYLQELDADTDPVKWAVSHNLHRRHLTTSQRAMVAARIIDIYKEHAKERMKRKPKGRFTCHCGEQFDSDVWHCEKCGHHWHTSDDVCKNCRSTNAEPVAMEKLPYQNGTARDEAGKAVNVSGKLVDAAAVVLERGSKDLIAKVDAGEVAVSKAAQIAKTVEKREQIKAIEQPAPKPERDVFKRLRAVFDAMTEAERQTAVDMWADWISETR